MAEVFLATDDEAPAGSPPVVIKRMHAELERDRDAVDLFLTEADVTLLLSHPNVIRVYDSGEVDGRYYMSMEYVHGKDLEQIADRFKAKNMYMDPAWAVYIVTEMLKGLGYVHGAKTPSGRDLGIVHRDVTPSNIYVSSTGQVKLGDFGVAKLVGVEGWTMAGSIKGKLGYLSPEQIAGDPPSQSIDLWATAIILYELLCNGRAFTGANELDIMLRIKGAKVAKLRKVHKGAPKALEKILQCALHKKEKKRYQSADEFIGGLDAYQEKDGKQYTPESLVQYIGQALA